METMIPCEQSFYVGQELMLTISSVSSSGQGIGSHQGLKIFVDGALPTESVVVKLTELKKNYATAQLLSINSPSSERTDPLCPLFGECGGCQIMHLQYPAQLKLKQKRVKESIQRIGGFTDCHVLPCLPSPTSLGYRNKLQLPLVWENGKKQIGLYRKQSHEVIPITHCLIQCPHGDEILRLITEKLTVQTVRHILIRNAIFNEEALVILVSTGQFSKELKKVATELVESYSIIKGVVENLNYSSDNVILGPTFRLLAGRPYIYEKLLNKTFKISPSAFFQINSAQTEKLYEYAIKISQIASSDIVLDAYCGVGALAIFAAAQASRSYGIECIPHAIADAIENARINKLKNCSFMCGKAEEMIHQLSHLDLVFLNPPRKGCEPTLLTALLAKKPRKIVYISCDPATLARDLARLSPTYQIDAIQPFDMFPQTIHVETVVRLTHKDKGR